MDYFDPEDYQVCPYDPTHIIRNKRMQPHIRECRKHHTSMGMVKCPFNAAHIIPEAERRWHLLQCPDRHQIHSKIIQEMMENTGVRGCVETPVYRPVTTHGETWDATDEVSQEPELFLPGQARGSVQKVHVQEQEFEGLSLRQKRQLYIQKKAEQEEAMNTQKRNPVPSRVMNVKGSKSLALLHQQRQAGDVHFNQSLEGPTRSSIVVGRGQEAIRALNRASPGQQAAASAATATPLSPIRPGGRGQAAQVSFNATTGQQYHLRPLVPTGPMQDLLPSHIPSSGDSSSVDGGYYTVSPRTINADNTYSVGTNGRGPLIRTGFEPSFSATVGNGIGLRMAVDGGSGGAAAPMQRCVWQGGDMSGNHTDVLTLGRGFSTGVSPYLSGSGIPFGGIASQPEYLVPSFSKMNLSVSTSPFQASSNVGNGQAKQLRVSEDTERFVDSPLWVGRGYAQEQAQQCQPSASTSSQSLGSEHEAVESWAAHMESVEPQHWAPEPAIPQSTSGYASSNLSESATDSDYQDPGEDQNVEEAKNEDSVSSMLRKVKKKLKQIRQLEEKMMKGQTLDEDQEKKMKKKQMYEKEAAELEDLLKQKDGS